MTAENFGRVTSVDCHPKEPWILTSLYSGIVCIWNYQTQIIAKSFIISELPVWSAKFIEQKEWIVSCTDMFIHIDDYNTMSQVKEFMAHSDCIRCLAVHPTLAFVLSSSDDKLIKLWDWEKGWVCSQTFCGHSRPVMQVTFNPNDMNMFASASFDGTIMIWNLNYPQPNSSWVAHLERVNCVDFITGGDKLYLITGSNDHTAKVWDYATQSLVVTLGSHQGNVSAVCFNPELAVIVTGSEDGAIIMWHATTYGFENSFFHGGSTCTVGSLRNSRWVVIGYDEGIRILNIVGEAPVINSEKSFSVKLTEIYTVNIQSLETENLLDDVWEGSKGFNETEDDVLCEEKTRWVERDIEGIGQHDIISLDNSQYWQGNEVPSQQRKLNATNSDVTSEMTNKLPTHSHPYLGIVNQGTTCYISSFLQVLYHIPRFRKAVYQAGTSDGDDSVGIVTRGLQHIFLKLQFGGASVGIEDFTHSCGWDSHQHEDVHEFGRTLFQKLEEEGSVGRENIQQLFEGIWDTLIDCVKVKYSSKFFQPFHDLYLVVKGCPDVYSSLDLLTASEDLCGDNAYDSEMFGLQDATTFSKFKSLPPVLQLHLGRINRSEVTAVKINDQYKFPLELNLDEYSTREPDPGRTYTLQSVLVHTGGVNRGHFYVYIRPTLSDKWFKFNDESVTEVDSRMALDGQYGGEEATRENQGNAYMLIYIRKSEKDKIFCDVGVEDLPRHLLARLTDVQKPAPSDVQKPAPSDVPERVAPVCSCTGKQVQCRKDGDRWESRCCTQNLSVCPLPQSTRGRRMRYSKYEKILEKLVAGGHDISHPIDLKSHWAKSTRL